MAQLIQNAVDWYYDIMDNKSDPRVNQWFMMSGPLPTIAASLCYAVFVTKIGPRLMQNRKPLELKNILIVYNAIQVAISTWLFYEAAVTGWLTTYSYRCQPVDFSNDPMAVRMATGCWWYYMSKFSEFFDTLFFVLRKKFSHISALHVVHHGIMPVSVWLGVKFFPGGQSTFFGFLNTGVHVIMYTYYMLAAMGPALQPYLWWKKHLTALQMVQFVLVIIHSVQTLFIECDYPKGYSYFIGAHGVLFLVLFSNFYRQKYSKSKARKVAEANSTNKPSSIPGVCFTTQTALYETSDKLHSKKISNGYTTDNTLRNRAFIDKQGE